MAQGRTMSESLHPKRLIDVLADPNEFMSASEVQAQMDLQRARNGYEAALDREREKIAAQDRLAKPHRQWSQWSSKPETPEGGPLTAAFGDEVEWDHGAPIPPTRRGRRALVHETRMWSRIRKSGLPPRDKTPDEATFTNGQRVVKGWLDTMSLQRAGDGVDLIGMMEDELRTRLIRECQQDGHVFLRSATHVTNDYARSAKAVTVVGTTLVPKKRLQGVMTAQAPADLVRDEWHQYQRLLSNQRINAYYNAEISRQPQTIITSRRTYEQIQKAAERERQFSEVPNVSRQSPFYIKPADIHTPPEM